MITPGGIRWPQLPGVAQFTLEESAVLALDPRFSPTQQLAQLILDDVAWLSTADAEATRPEGPILAEVAHSLGGRAVWEAQSEELRGQLTRLAGACEELLAAGSVELAPGGAREPSAILLAPPELAAMASRILGLLDRDRTPGTWLTALELASRLPVLAARAGFTPRRPAGHDPLLTPELVELLAPQVHLAYQRISEETGNATGSPLALKLWENLDDFTKASNRAAITGSAVTHAAAGRDVASPHEGGRGAAGRGAAEGTRPAGAPSLGHSRTPQRSRGSRMGQTLERDPGGPALRHRDHAPPAPDPGRRKHRTGNRPGRRPCRHISGSRLSRALTGS